MNTLEEQLGIAEGILDKANDRVNDHYAFYGDCDMSKEGEDEWIAAFDGWLEADAEVKRLKALIEGEKA